MFEFCHRLGLFPWLDFWIDRSHEHNHKRWECHTVHSADVRPHLWEDAELHIADAAACTRLLDAFPESGIATRTTGLPEARIHKGTFLYAVNDGVAHHPKEY